MTQPWIPIYSDHDRTQREIGRFRQVDGQPFLEAQFVSALSKEQVFQIFGGAGMRVTSQCIGVDTIRPGDALIDALHIYEFSLSAQPATPARPVK